MKVGICGTLDQMQSLADTGADYLETNVRNMIAPEQESWTAPLPTANALPIIAANSFIPPEMRLTGHGVDRSVQDNYLHRVLSRAGQTQVRTIVFGSGAARQVPEAFSLAEAREQLVDFARRAATIAETHGIMIVIESLNSRECNILNTLGESARLVEAVSHPNLQLLLDSYHFWLEDDSLDELARRLPMIRHVHVADKIDRLNPGESGEADYRPMFALLKSADYDGTISIEAAAPKSPDVLPRSIKYVRDAWRDA